MTNTGLEQGKFHAQRLNYAEALDCFRQELRLQPSLGNCWLQYGFVLEKLGVYAEAITANRNAQALLRNPMAQVAPPPAQNSAAVDAAIAALETNASYWWQRGQTLTDLGEYHEAIACLQKSLDLVPHSPAWFSHANVAAALERYDEALASYDQ
ncbi:MAG TPA: tetratricopeptide repeat protein, partial [Stenomitos sp.]